MNDEEQVVTTMPHRWLIFSGLLVVILGGVAIGALFITGLVMAVAIGFVLMISGMAQLLHVLKTGPFGHFFMDFVSAMLSIICGALMVLHPVLGLDFLTLLLIIYFLVQGLTAVAFGIGRSSLKGRAVLLMYGVCEFLLGALFWYQWPFSGEWAIGIIVGVHLILTGLSMMSNGLVLRKISVSGARIAVERSAGRPM